MDAYQAFSVGFVAGAVMSLIAWHFIIGRTFKRKIKEAKAASWIWQEAATRYHARLTDVNETARRQHAEAERLKLKDKNHDPLSSPELYQRHLG